MSILEYNHPGDGTRSDELAAFASALEDQLREARNAWYDSLPDFPASGECVCGNDGSEYGAWQAVEIGYTRYTNGEWRDDHLHLSTDGWDDMSEGGQLEWIECNAYNGGCGRSYKTPEDLEWD